MMSRWVKSFLTCLVLNCAVAVGARTAAVEIGGRWELLVDDYLIDNMTGQIELRLHRPVPREVVLIHDRPWEGNTCGYHTIFKDGDLYRMYYRGWGVDDQTQRSTHPAFVCYAESRDGVHWARPDLGLVEFQGSKENNIILTGPGTHNFVPFKDANPQCPPEARYKAVARGEDQHHQALLAFQSPDGLHWTPVRPEPIITEGAFDSQNLVFWDAVRGEYRCYFRDFRDGVRDIKTSTSEDFLQWSRPQWLAFPNAPKEHLYTNQVQPYSRAPHLFVGFPTRYIPDRGSLTEGLFMSSRDGRVFHRWGEAFIRPGQNRDRWHNRSNYIWLGLVETASELPGAGTELSLYTNERYYQGPGGKTRRYTIRVDGFVSVNATLRGGEAVTKPLIFEGKRLRMNYSTSAAGTIRVEIQDTQGRPISGFALDECPAIYGDQVEGTIAWKAGSDVGGLAGQPIRLRLVLNDADIYAFGFAP